MILTHQLDPEPCTAVASAIQKTVRPERPQAGCEPPCCLNIGKAKLEFPHLSRLFLPHVCPREEGACEDETRDRPRRIWRRAPDIFVGGMSNTCTCTCTSRIPSPCRVGLLKNASCVLLDVPQISAQKVDWPNASYVTVDAAAAKLDPQAKDDSESVFATDAVLKVMRDEVSALKSKREEFNLDEQGLERMHNYVEGLAEKANSSLGDAAPLEAFTVDGREMTAYVLDHSFLGSTLNSDPTGGSFWSCALVSITPFPQLASFGCTGFRLWANAWTVITELAVIPPQNPCFGIWHPSLPNLYANPKP